MSTDERLDDPATAATAARPETGQRAKAAETLAPLIGALFPEGPPIRFRFWDGSAIGPDSGAQGVFVRSPRALRRIVWSPDELGLSRSYIAGDIDLEGDIFTTVAALQLGASEQRRPDLRTAISVLDAARRLGALGLPLSRPPEEARLRGPRHSKLRDASAITHHYDVGNEFYELVLGPSMTYSCARFERESFSLEQAQFSKHELICRKLGLPDTRSARLLDVGCGWGSMAIHAAKEHGARVTAITISRSQAEYARRRVEAAKLADQVEIRLQDYRDLTGERFDAISSIGMFEHVGTERMSEYFESLKAQLVPTGRLLNHAISKAGGSRLEGRTFTNRYVFPDGELIDVANVIKAMEACGFEVRDVESLREHYARTLRSWVANLDAHWDEAVRLVGESRARVWRLYMAGSANGFADGDLAVHQVLGVVRAPHGESGMPPTRMGWD